MKYTFHIVDVFSSAPFRGNQLAVLPDAAGYHSRGKARPRQSGVRSEDHG
jgi:predicted PhzF superfamily epimerase YddE/YHI9